MEPEKKSVNEERIRKITTSYYSRLDIRKSMLDFAKNREISPRYFEGFGKRPDTLNFESDILELVKKGATSFHSSEELWQDPLEISTGLGEEQLNKLRIGWDLLIDIDSKYFDYSRIYAEILIKILREHGIKNIGVKFSGSKGFHIIVPWEAFPKQVSGNQAKNMFPEWPRFICKYLGKRLSNELKERILDLSLGGKEKKQDQLEIYCIQCSGVADQTHKIFLQCSHCKSTSEAFEEAIKRKRILRCPNCTKEMQEIRKQPIFKCQTCDINSKTSPNKFKERIKTKNIDADIILVSPRHLFRMPYSLHEKTSLASVVIDPDKVKDFQLKDAHPLKIATPKSFYPTPIPGEATNLLVKAIEDQGTENQEEMYATVSSLTKNQPNTRNPKNKNQKFKEITITNLTPEIYPPTIKTILKGMPSDGRKRALFILLNYLRSVKLENEKIEKTVTEWNKKNYEPLKTGYIRSQLMWHFRTSPKLPPNYSKPYYKEIGINPTQSEIKAKNPVSYTIRISFAKQHSKDEKNNQNKNNSYKKK
jgi:DNA primase catalytic subunit